MQVQEIFRTFKKPRNLAVVKTDGLDPETRLALSALQGLVNAIEPRIYQVTGAWDQHWLRYYKQRFNVQSRRLRDPLKLFKLYEDVPRGIVIYDPAIPDTKNLATTIAGLKGLLPAGERLAQKLQQGGLTIREDLRGRFKDRISAYAWAKDQLLPRCNRRVLGSLCAANQAHWLANRTELVDYLVASRSFVFHLSSARRDRQESQLFDQILEAAGGPGVLMGWHCIRDQEKEYVARAARKGFFVLCSPQSPNLTVHAGIPRSRKRYAQRKPETPARIEKKVYVALYMTDGDAIWAMNNLQSGNWLSKKRGSIRFNWGLLPLMYDIMPGMLEYYYETATANDYFVCPSSGAAYTYSFLHDDWYLHYSKRYMELTGQTCVNMVNWDTNYWWREVEDPDAICREKRILRPIGLVCGLGGSVFARSYPLGTPKIHAALVLHAGEDCAQKIRIIAERIKTRPLFIFAFVQIAPGVYDRLVGQVSSLPDEVEILQMDTFMMALREATRRGLVTDDLYPEKHALEDVMLREPGKREKEASKRLFYRLSRICSLPLEEMVKELNLGNWHLLAAQEPSAVEKDVERWKVASEGYMPYDTESPADALAYNLFYVCWAYVRSCLNESGIYANHMDSCLDEYMQQFPERDSSALAEVWDMWHSWYQKQPTLEKVLELVRRIEHHIQQAG